ncbi:MAG TPA: SGNH/GDSL hydrolase family protein, partial [Solirubrobacteraceae bacterium]|nr:SGNH/GDSL hydrolase family protein [Solirubrobacteraceae bacterium]
LALENEYLAEHKAEVEMEGYEIGLEKAAEFQVTHAAELEKEGLEIVVAGLKKAAPALFAQIETNLIAIVYDLRKYAPKAKINFLATYDPYGRLTGPTELLPGSNELNEELNLQEKSKLKAKVLKGCVANPRPDFNPGTFPAEAVALATLTNMANTNHTNGKADGPDIHPTKLGYEKLAEALKNQCKY